MQGMYSMRSPAVKRLMKEASELREPTEQYACHPLEDNLFEWHFTIRGPAGSEFEGGLYHGRIILPPDYPMKPPSIILLTPNGRFETNKKICLSISGHHPESWQPSWSIRTALLAIIGFMPTHGAGALGSLDYTPEERKVLAKRSQDYKCPNCGSINNILKEVTEESETTKREAQELAAQMSFQDEQEKNAALKVVSSQSQATPTSDSLPVSSDSSTDQLSTASNTPLPPSSQFPQFPFTPYMPQFPHIPPFSPHGYPQSPNQMATSPALAQIPRFPLPFVSPFMTPFPPFLPRGGLPMAPGGPGMYAPWAVGAWPRPMMPSQASFANSARNATTTAPSTLNTLSPPSNAAPTLENSAVSPSSSAASATASSTATGSNLGEVSSPSTPASTSEATTPTDDIGSTARETTSFTSSSPASNASGVASAGSVPTSSSQSQQTGLRHRNPETTERGVSTTTNVNQSAELGRANRQTESGTGFMIFVAVIMSIIVLLLLRRLHAWNVFSFLYDNY